MNGSSLPGHLEHVVTLRRSWRSLLPRLLLAFSVGILGAWLSIRGGGMLNARVPLPAEDLSIELPVFLLLFLFLLARPVFLRLDSYSEIRPHHLQTTRGIVSLRRLQTAVPYEDIRGVKVEQALWERLLGCGTLVCWSVSAEAPELRIAGVANVRAHAETIGQRIDFARLSQRGSHPASPKA